MTVDGLQAELSTAVSKPKPEVAALQPLSGELGPLKPLGGGAKLGPLKPLGPVRGSTEPEEPAPQEDAPSSEPASDGSYKGPDPTGKICGWKLNVADGWSYSPDTSWIYNHVTAVYCDPKTNSFCKYAAETGVVPGTCQPDASGAIHFVPDLPTIKTAGPLSPIGEVSTEEISELVSPVDARSPGAASDLSLSEYLPEQAGEEANAAASEPRPASANDFEDEIELSVEQMEEELSIGPEELSTTASEEGAGITFEEDTFDEGKSAARLADDSATSPRQGSVAAARRMFETPSDDLGSEEPQKAAVMDENVRRQTSMKMAFTQLRSDLATTTPDTPESDVEAIEVDDEIDDEIELDVSDDDAELLAMFDAPAGSLKPAGSGGLPASPPSAGLLGEPPSVGAADEDDDLVEEYLEDFEESGSTDFVDFDSVKVSA